jgi:L-rhamnose isomerase
MSAQNCIQTPRSGTPSGEVAGEQELDSDRSGENRMTELEKIGAELAKLVLAIPTWETGSGKEYYEVRKSLWEGIQTKAREFLRVSEEAHRK